MANCFTCGQPNATHSDRQVSFLLMRNAIFCKDDFRLALKDVQDVLKARPKGKAIIDRIFGVKDE